MARDFLEILEVSPRDGLQNESATLTTAAKLDLIDRIVACGFRRFEAGSFVNPVRVPQMADTPEVFAGLSPAARARSIALALNPRGVERAVAAGAQEVTYVVCASEGFALRNQGAPLDAILAAWPLAARLAREGGVRLSAIVATAFGCPFDGETAPAILERVCDALLCEPVQEIALADTIGVAAPREVTERFNALRRSVPRGVALRAHFHNTRNTALANAIAAVDAGVTVLDGSLAGIGGCPFAPGATGNAPSEDLIYMFERMGFDLGVDLDGAIEAARGLASALGKESLGGVSRAGRFPKGKA